MGGNSYASLAYYVKVKLLKNPDFFFYLHSTETTVLIYVTTNPSGGELYLDVVAT